MLTKQEFEQLILRLKAMGIKVILSESRPEKEKISKWFNKNNLNEIIDILNNFKKETGISEVSFIYNKNQVKGSRKYPALWQQKRRNRIVINFYGIFTIKELKVGLEVLIKKIKIVQKTPVVSRVESPKEEVRNRLIITNEPIKIPSSAQEYFEQGVALAKAGDLKGASENFEQAHKLDPTNLLFRYQLSLCLLRIYDESGDYKQRERAYELRFGEGGRYFDPIYNKFLQEAREREENVIEFAGKEEF